MYSVIYELFNLLWEVKGRLSPFSCLNSLIWIIQLYPSRHQTAKGYKNRINFSFWFFVFVIGIQPIYLHHHVLYLKRFKLSGAYIDLNFLVPYSCIVVISFWIIVCLHLYNDKVFKLNQNYKCIILGNLLIWRLQF